MLDCAVEFVYVCEYFRVCIGACQHVCERDKVSETVTHL